MLRGDDPADPPTKNGHHLSRQRFLPRADGLVGPQRPVDELLQGGAARAVDHLLVVKRARVHARPAEAGLGAAADRGGAWPSPVWYQAS